MRTKFALIIAFASLMLVVVLGAAFAGADPLSQGSAVDPGTTTTVPSLSLQAPACANGLDDDGDGLVDELDPDCETPADKNEAPETAAPEQPADPGANPQPAPEPSPTPAPDNGGVKQGTGIVGNNPAGKDGVTQNEGLDNPSGGSRNGAVTAPSANGGGDQPAPEGTDGGSQYSAGGTPTTANPTTTIAPFGPAPIGVPNFVIDSFEIPPFLLPIYQACGTEYGIPWEVLASINKIETAFGTNLNVSSAGALGWMQFLPSSWETFGLDANGDGRKDPYNPVDAICAAAHYLKLAGGNHDLYQAIFSYNHADWYVQEVLLYARAYGRLPSDLVGSLTGLTEGAHFPIAADARYADDIAARKALQKGESPDYGNAAEVISSSPTPRGINIFSKQGAPVVAVNDGIIRKLGSSDRLGNFVVLEDTYGNSYTYAELGNLVRDRRLVVEPTGQERRVPVESQNLRPRLRALPGRADSEGAAKSEDANALREAVAASSDGSLKVGSKVIAGTVLARVAAGTEGVDSHINFSIRPAGKGAPRIDPKPILDGWKLLEATAIYRAKGKSPFAKLSGAGVLLLSKEALQKRVLADEDLEIYECGREDIAAGRIDRRILAMLEYLSTNGYKLSITSLECGHGVLTTSGNVSEHTTGTAVDIAVINGIPVTGHQGPGTPTDELIHEVLRLQGTMHPHQVISLEDLPGETSFALPDHYDHVHVGYHPTAGGSEARFAALLKPEQWQRLISRLGEIENPDVPVHPSKYSLPDKTNGGLSAGGD
jgi:hypothetical protein